MKPLNTDNIHSSLPQAAKGLIWQVGYRLTYSFTLTFFTVLAVMPIVAIVHQWQNASFGSIFSILIDIIYFPLLVRGTTVIRPEDIVLAGAVWIGVFAVITYFHDKFASAQRPWTESISQTVHGPYIIAYVSLSCALPYLPGADKTDLRSSYIWIATFFMLGYAAYWMARSLQWVRLELERTV